MYINYMSMIYKIKIKRRKLNKNVDIERIRE